MRDGKSCVFPNGEREGGPEEPPRKDPITIIPNLMLTALAPAIPLGPGGWRHTPSPPGVMPGRRGFGGRTTRDDSGACAAPSARP